MTDDKLPAGATLVPRAGRPEGAPGLAAEQPAAAVKRDASAASRLPDLYKKLGEAKQILARATDGGQTLDVYAVNLHIGGEGMTLMVHDKAAFSALVIKDLEAMVAARQKEITDLGFEVG